MSTLTADSAEIIEYSERPRRFREALSLLAGNKLALAGAITTLCFVIVGIIGWAVLIIPGLKHLYLDQNLEGGLKPPLSSGHLLGTDNYGRDMGWRIVAGIGISLFVAGAVTFGSIVIGMTLGSIAGYFRGKTDTTISALIDLTWGFPLLLVAVIMVGIFQPGLVAVIVAVALVNWAGFARIIRAETVSLREREFVEAAHALGISHTKTIARHIVPNTIGSTLVMTSYYVAYTVIAEAGLAFIGLGAQPPTPSLGQMVASGRDYLYVDSYQAIIPGVVIALMVLGFNTLGDGLRDIFDPRLRRF